MRSKRPRGSRQDRRRSRGRRGPGVSSPTPSATRSVKGGCRSGWTSGLGGRICTSSTRTRPSGSRRRPAVRTLSLSGRGVPIVGELGLPGWSPHGLCRELEAEGPLVDTASGVGRVLRTARQADKNSRCRRIAAIEAGEYPPGSQLPGEGHLTDQFGAFRNTIRPALANSTAEASSK
ncbi:GntR family transcriptional regulator [Actinoallomurus acaciae]|uniref:GntR family transcriptional regulator n=1 Tax=Actinoallomurus acaciae TaxID=502577 RepID=A0ABV5YR97_9ACTN